jgi:hypothetical protein
MSSTDIVANIDQRLADLNAELTHLSGARAALLDDAAPVIKTTATRKRRLPTKNSYDVVPAGKLIALLVGDDGLSTRELSRQTNADPGQVLALLKDQEDAGQVRRSGSRAATRWHAITDEDRIAARVVELQASSRRARARRS